MKNEVDWKIRLGNFFFKYRAISPIPFIIILFVCFQPRNLGERNAWINLVGLAVILLGITLRVLAVGYSRSGTSGRENFLRAENLNVDGVYSVVRNPLYVGNFIVYSGLLITFANLFAFIPFYLYLVVLYTFIIYSEEAYLTGQYGDAYQEYRRRTPRIIPGFRLYPRPSVPFNLRKVLFKEKNTVFYSMVFYMAILIYKEYLINAGIIEKTDILLYAAAALFGINVFLVILKRRHLNE